MDDLDRHDQWERTLNKAFPQQKQLCAECRRKNSEHAPNCSFWQTRHKPTIKQRLRRAYHRLIRRMIAFLEKRTTKHIEGDERHPY